MAWCIYFRLHQLEGVQLKRHFYCLIEWYAAMVIYDRMDRIEGGR